MWIFLVLIFVLCSGSFKKIGSLKSQISYTKTIGVTSHSKLGDSEFLHLDKDSQIYIKVLISSELEDVNNTKLMQ